MLDIKEGRTPLDTSSWTGKTPTSEKYAQYDAFRFTDSKILAENLNTYFNDQGISKIQVADILNTNKSVITHWNTRGYSATLSSSAILARDVLHCEVAELLCAKKWPIEATVKLSLYYKLFESLSPPQRSTVSKKLLELKKRRSVDLSVPTTIYERILEACEDRELQLEQFITYKTACHRKFILEVMGKESVTVREQTLMFVCYCTGISPDFFVSRDYSYATILVDGTPIKAGRKLDISQFLMLSGDEQNEIIAFAAALKL